MRVRSAVPLPTLTVELCRDDTLYGPGAARLGFSGGGSRSTVERDVGAPGSATSMTAGADAPDPTQSASEAARGATRQTVAETGKNAGKVGRKSLCSRR